MPKSTLRCSKRNKRWYYLTYEPAGARSLAGFVLLRTASELVDFPLWERPYRSLSYLPDTLITIPRLISEKENKSL